MKNSPFSNPDENISFDREFIGELDFDELNAIAEEMKSCYLAISNSILLLENSENLDEALFRENTKIIEEQSDRLQICLDSIGRIDPERKKFESMYNYYREFKQNCMDKMMEKIDKSDFDIRERLQKNFDLLSIMILKIGDRKGGGEIFDKLDKIFVSIKDKLDSDEVKEQMTVLEYNSRVDKYNQAMDYVKKAYL